MNVLTSLWRSIMASPGSAEGSSPPASNTLRERWGHEISRERDMETIAFIHQVKPATADEVDSQTWQDLAMDDVFAAIDRTESVLGQQTLYARLRGYLKDDLLRDERTRHYELFRRKPDLREYIQGQLARFQRPGAEFLSSLLLRPLPPIPKYAGWFFILSGLAAVCPLGIPFFPQLLLAVLVLLCVNTVIYVVYGRKVSIYFPGFTQIDILLGVAEQLGQLPESDEVAELRELRKHLPIIKRVKKRLGSLVADRTNLPDIAQAVFAYLNIFLLFETLVFIRSVRALRSEQNGLVTIMELVGSLDASISTASYIEGLPYCCTPQLLLERHLQATGLYHPLITDPVGNSFSLSNRSAVIVGPNMAGKTSFVRTVGINLILALTLNICLAREAVFPRAILRSAIRREDSLAEGASYFFSEIKQILEFTQLNSAAGFHLLLIDEIFRGTNTIERIACSVAVLRHLAQNHLVLVTTHDAELQKLLEDSFEMFHFNDCVVDGKYGFDYLIRSGMARSRNAIKLLEISGYPRSIIKEAEALAQQLGGE